MKKLLLIVTFLSLGLLLLGCNDPVYSSNEGPFTVTFDAQGGSEVEPMEVEKHAYFLPTTVPVKEGYLFAGWYLDENFYYPMAFSAGIATHITLYAKWMSPHEVDTEALRAIVDAFLIEKGYHLTLLELLTSLEDMLSPLMLTDEQIQLIIQDILNDTSFDLSESDLDFLVEKLLSNDELMTTLLSHINVAELFENHVTQLLAEASQSVVMIDTYDGNYPVSGGSGVIYKRDGNNYYVLTNDHVVYNYDRNQYYANNQIAITIFHETGQKVIIRSSTNIRVLGKSITHDLAIIRFTSTDDLRVMEFGSYQSLKVGQFVFAIGSPLDLPNTSSMGIISQFDRGQTDGYGMATTMIQHTASINPGNSGGALINLQGELIGINTMSYVDMEVGEGIEGLNFAVQINIILTMIPFLEND